MNLKEAVEALGQGKKIRRIEWPEGAYLQMQGAFSPTPLREEQFKEWIEEGGRRKFVVYFDGVESLSRPEGERLNAYFDLQNPMAAVGATWELLG
jgi:hypothetical protein